MTLTMCFEGGSPVKYEGDREVADLAAYIKKNGKKAGKKKKNSKK